MMIPRTKRHTIAGWATLLLLTQGCGQLDPVQPKETAQPTASTLEASADWSSFPRQRDLLSAEDDAAAEEDLRVLLARVRDAERAEPSSVSTEEEMDEAILPSEAQPYVLDGQVTGNYPVVMLSTNGGKFICTGTIISKEHILTAAHCLRDANNNVIGTQTAVVDVSLRWRATDGTNKNGLFPGYALRHAEFVGGSPSLTYAKRDVGLLTVPGFAWAEDSSSNRMRIITSAPSAVVGTTLNIFGWGQSAITGGGGGALRKGRNGALITVASAASDQFHANAADARTCVGDSGGPAVVKIGGNQVLAGIMSWARHDAGEVCPRQGYPMYWHNPGAVYSWIKSNLALANITCTKFADGYARCW